MQGIIEVLLARAAVTVFAAARPIAGRKVSSTGASVSMARPLRSASRSPFPIVGTGDFCSGRRLEWVDPAAAGSAGPPATFRLWRAVLPWCRPKAATRGRHAVASHNGDSHSAPDH
jgi:hypothetical protein